MSDLFDDLEDFGSFDDAISGDVRDPYTELARIRREEPVQRLETSGALPHEESLPMFIVYRHEDVQQMLRDNETFSSVRRHRGLRSGAGRRGDARHGRADPRPAAWTRLEGVRAEVVGAVGGRARRSRGQRPHRQVRGQRQGRSGEGVHLRLSKPDHRRSTRTARGGLSAVPAVVDLAVELDDEPGTGTCGLGCAVRLLRTDPGSSPGRAARRSDQRARSRRDRRGKARPTRRSSRSFGSFCLPASRRHTGRWAACSSRCCRTRTNSRRFVPTARCFRRRSRRACGGNRRC